MARRGSFGRMPRPAQNLTNTVIAITREMQAQRDQNIMNAWKSGGLFEDKKVTDEMIVKYWRDRANSVDKNDPLYDMYANAAQEYEYSIAESKVTLAYAQGKMSAQAAAAFYTNWSKKVPQNSEFWRILQRDAAQLLRSVRANGEAERKRREEAKYQNDITDIYNTKIKAGQYLTDVFTLIARRGLQAGGGESLVDHTQGSLFGFAPDDVSRFLQMINGMSTGGAARIQPSTKATVMLTDASNLSGSANVLYHDDNGQPVTGLSIIAELRKIDPSFSGAVTLDTLNTYLEKVQEGLDKSEALAESTGHLTDAKKYADQKADVAELRREVRAYPVEQAYLSSREAMLKVVNDPKASAMDRIDAINKHRGNLLRFAEDPRVKTNDVFVNKLLGEANGKEETTSAAEDFTGNLGADANRGDVAKQNAVLARAEEAVMSVARGEAVWTTGEYDKDGFFSPSAGGSAIGAATPQDIANNAGGIQPQVLVGTDMGGRTTTVAVMGQPITVLAVDPVTGGALKPDAGTNSVFGQMFVTPDGRKFVQYRDGTGKTLVSSLDDAPWGPGAKLTENSQGFVLTLTAPANSGQLPNSGFRLVSDGKKQSLVYDPYTATLATDREHWSAIQTGGDPSTDFRSINTAYYATDPAKMDQYNKVRGTEAYRNIVEEQTRLNSGMTPRIDPATGRVLGWDGDSKAYDRGAAQNGRAEAGQPVGGDWGRDAKASDLLPGPHENLPTDNLFGSGGGVGDVFGFGAGLAPLATSTLSDTGFKPLGDYFAAGTLNAKPVQVGAEGSSEITMINKLKVPTPPAPARDITGGGGSTSISSSSSPATGVTYSGSTGFTIPGSVTGGSTSSGTGYYVGGVAKPTKRGVI